MILIKKKKKSRDDGLRRLFGDGSSLGPIHYGPKRRKGFAWALKTLLGPHPTLHPPLDELMRSFCFLLPSVIPNPSEQMPLGHAMLLTKLPACTPILRWNHAIAMDVSPLPSGDEDDGGGLSDAERSPLPEEGGLPGGLLSDWMPRHVSVIMDGNARWARRRGLPPSAGHEAGLRSLRELVRRCFD